MSNWCDPKKWFKDYLLTKPNNTIPKNKINDVNIQKQNYIFSIQDNTCFQQIPYLDCNNITIIIASGTIDDNSKANFTCENLNAANIRVGKNITLKHWENDTQCTYNCSSISASSGTTFDKIVCEVGAVTGTGFYTSNSTLNSSIIYSDILCLDSGTNITCSNPNYPNIIAAQSGLFINVLNINSPNNNTILNGKFYIQDLSIIDCTGIGTFSFDNSSLGPNGYLKGSITLKNKSISSGQIIGSNILFVGSGTTNFGTVSGDCIFISGASNKGNISGLAIFSGVGSINYGNVSDKAYFYNTKNSGNVSQLAIFYDSENYGNLYNGAMFYNSSNRDRGMRSGEALFNNSANYALVSGSNISFVSGSNNYWNSEIYGDNIILNSGINYGNIWAESGSIIFKNNSQNYGSGKALEIQFFDNSTNNGSLISLSGSTFNFFNRSINYSTIAIYSNYSKINFYNSSINNYYISISGNNSNLNFYNKAINSGIANIANFYNNSINFGSITETGLFYNSTINYSTGNYSLYFCDKSINSGSSNVLLFRDNTKNYGSGIYGAFFNSSDNASTGLLSYLNYADFFDSSINRINGIITTGNGHFANFYNKSINFAVGLDSILFSFYNQSINSGVCSRAIFSGLSKNINYVNSGTFKSKSFNDVKGSGHDLYFYDYSYNKGYIENSGYFYNNSTNENTAFVSGALFTDYSINKSSFTPPSSIFLYDNPTIKFSGYSKNYGSIVDSYVSFEDNSINSGNIADNTWIIFNDSGIFYKGVDVSGRPRLQHYGPSGNLTNDTYEFLYSFYDYDNVLRLKSLSFKNKSINYGNIKGYYSYSFTDEAINYGNLSCFPVVPKLHQIAIFSGTNKSSGCYNFADILDGKSIFINTINSGQTLYPYFDNSINYGNILGTATGDFIYSSSSQSLSGFSGVYFVKSTNYGQSKIYTNFNQSKNYGNIFNDSDFFDNSVNYAFIANSANFIYSNNIGGDIGGNITMYSGVCLGANIRGNASFTYVNYISKDFYSAYTLYPFVAPVSMGWDGDTADKYNLYSISGLNNDWWENNKLLQNLTTQNSIKGYALFNNSNNYGGLLNTASFYNGKNFGSIKNPVIFENNSINAYGSKLDGLSVFIGSVNFGEINTTNFDTNYIINNESFLFYINNLQNNYPVISGELESNQYGTIFISSTNSGTINTPSIFDHSTNTYLINKQSIFINSTNDRKNDINTNDTINQIFPYPLYPVPYPLQTFNNFTNPPTKQTYSHDHIIQAKYGIIQDCILINGGNNALIKNGIFYNSTNYGEVSGNAILNNSNNLGSNYTREAIIYSNNPVILNNSNNSARIYANTIFNSGSSNDYIVIGNTVFNQAVNNGTITGNAILNQSRNYGYIAGNAIFNSGQNIGYQVPDLYGPTAYRNVGGYIAGNAVFVSGSCNNAYATITGFIEQDGTSIDC